MFSRLACLRLRRGSEVHEIKHDGYRLVVRQNGADAALRGEASTGAPVATVFRHRCKLALEGAVSKLKVLALSLGPLAQVDQVQKPRERGGQARGGGRMALKVRRMAFFWPGATRSFSMTDSGRRAVGKLN
jgi:hypothetical protein